ncbi:hypothetical protein KUTeg_017624, partial [Tegillarca granosa]
MVYRSIQFFKDLKRFDLQEENRERPEPGKKEKQRTIIEGYIIWYEKGLSILFVINSGTLRLRWNSNTEKTLKFGSIVNSCFKKGKKQAYIVQISVQSCGVCATDVKIYRYAKVPGPEIEMPFILGHEASGSVSKLGKEVTSLKLGDRVATEPWRICRYCDLCKSGNYNLCNVKNSGKCFARYVVLPEDFCHNTYLHKIHCTIDLLSEKLEHAKRLGADNTFLVKDQSIPELVDELVKLIGKKPDVVIECAGAKNTVELGMKITKPTGCLLVAGLGPSRIQVPLFETLLNEIDVRGSFAYTNNYPQALNLLSTGKVNMKRMITHRFPLEKVEDAMKLFEENPKDL